MKTFSLLALSVVTSITMGSTRADHQPNHFTCIGANGTQLLYSTTSLSGRPLMSVTFNGQKATLSAFPQIRVENVVLGQLISVTDESQAIADGPTIHYSFILPNVTLKSTATEEKFDSFLIQTSVVNPFFHATPFSGAAQQYEMVPVQCEANFYVS